MIATGCLLTLMSIATITDIWQQKIYNWTTYSGTLIAIGLSGLATATNRADLAEIGIRTSLLGLLVCGLVMLICFLFFQIGGGDVKLLAMAGAFLGPEFGIQTLLWTFVIGGATAVVMLIWRLGAWRLVGRVIQQLKCKFGFGDWDALSKEEKKQLQLKLYLAPSAFAATLVVKFSLIDRLMSHVSLAT